MFLISTRQIKNGAWSYFKVDDDTPQYFHISNSNQLEPDQLEAMPIASEAIQRIVEEAKNNMAASPMVFVFVHGFNNTVETAHRTTEDISKGLFDENILPALVCLSWSTDGRILNYEQDRSDARASALVISRVLRDLGANPEIADGSVSLVMLTHSMGNYLIDFACKKMGLGGGIPQKLFTHSVLVAADIECDDLNVGQEGDIRCQLSRHVTFYYSGWDGALAIAPIYHDLKPRFGKNGPIRWDHLYANSVGVNCADVLKAHTHDPFEGVRQVGVELHSSYFGNSTFYSDLAQCLRGVSPPNISTRRHPDGVPANSFRLKLPS